ncbi:hypothetical protein ACERNI_01270 [Camelimonas sp. ID_303_24]
MLSDSALLVTGAAFAAILGGAWYLHRRALGETRAPAPTAPVVVREPAASVAPAVAPLTGGPVRPGVAGQSKIETLVLKAALEDALEHLAEVYGQEYLDAFHARRMGRNVEPYRKLMAAVDDPAMAGQGLRQAQEAEDALNAVIAAVRKSPGVMQA